MTDPQPPVLVDNMLLLRKEDFDDLLERAAERGAKRALADVGLDGDDAAHDIRELRGLLDAFNTAKHTAWQTVIKMVTTGFLLALVAGALIKLKVFGGAQWGLCLLGQRRRKLYTDRTPWNRRSPRSVCEILCRRSAGRVAACRSGGTQTGAYERPDASS